jgi:hypothetical protein
MESQIALRPQSFSAITATSLAPRGDPKRPFPARLRIWGQTSLQLFD